MYLTYHYHHGRLQEPLTGAHHHSALSPSASSASSINPQSRSIELAHFTVYLTERATWMDDLHFSCLCVCCKMLRSARVSTYVYFGNNVCCHRCQESVWMQAHTSVPAMAFLSAPTIKLHERDDSPKTVRPCAPNGHFLSFEGERRLEDRLQLQL